ncbi:hypothetical protein BW895_30545, partial [Bacillus cereus]
HQHHQQRQPTQRWHLSKYLEGRIQIVPGGLRQAHDHPQRQSKATTQCESGQHPLEADPGMGLQLTGLENVEEGLNHQQRRRQNLHWQPFEVTDQKPAHQQRQRERPRQIY